MDRNISTVIEFHNNLIKINAIESIDNRLVLIYSKSQSITDFSGQSIFIANSVKELSNLVGGKISKADIVFSDSSLVEVKHNNIIVSTKIKDDVKQNDVDKLKQKVLNTTLNNKEESLAYFIPIKYKLFDSNNNFKEFKTLPIAEIGSKLELEALIYTIPQRIYSSFASITSIAGIKISKVLPQSHAINYSLIDSNDRNKGSLSINILKDKTKASLIRSNCTLVSKTINIGYDSLFEEISNNFGISYQEAKSIYWVYGNLDLKNSADLSKKIYLSKDATKSLTTMLDLNNVIKGFFDRVLHEIKDLNLFSDNKDIVYVFLSEIFKIKNFDEYMNAEHNNLNYYVFKGLDFITSNLEDVSSIGVTVLNNELVSIMKQLSDTIVHTNPKTISTLLKHYRKQNFLLKLVNKIIRKGNNAWT